MWYEKYLELNLQSPSSPWTPFLSTAFLALSLFDKVSQWCFCIVKDVLSRGLHLTPCALMVELKAFHGQNNWGGGSTSFSGALNYITAEGWSCISLSINFRWKLWKYIPLFWCLKGSREWANVWFLPGCRSHADTSPIILPHPASAFPAPTLKSRVLKGNFSLWCVCRGPVEKVELSNEETQLQPPSLPPPTNSGMKMESFLCLVWFMETHSPSFDLLQRVFFPCPQHLLVFS